MEQAEEIIIVSRMESLQRSELRLANLVLSESPPEVPKMFGVVKAEVTDLTRQSQAEAAGLKEKCKMVFESQQFYYDRVLDVQENIEKIELAKIEVLEADEKYKQVRSVKARFWSTDWNSNFIIY